VGRASGGPAGLGPGQPEQLFVKDPPVGDYELRVVNRTATGDSWKAHVQRLHQEPDVVTYSGKTEAWTLSCESADGKTVYGSREVVIGRGQQTSLDLSKTCKGKKTKK